MSLSVSEWQGYLLSCHGQLKMAGSEDTQVELPNRWPPARNFIVTMEILLFHMVWNWVIMIPFILEIGFGPFRMSLIVKLAPEAGTALPFQRIIFCWKLIFFSNTLCDCGNTNIGEKVLFGWRFLRQMGALVTSASSQSPFVSFPEQRLISCSDILLEILLLWVLSH